MPPQQQEEDKQSTYNKEYYRRFRRQINERRKRQYRRDADYRERVKQRRRQYYYAHKGPPRSRGRKGESVPRLFLHQGHTWFLYRVSALCRALRRHHNTVYSWVRQGIIPCYRDQKGGYWFLLEVVYHCNEIIDELGPCKHKREETQKLKNRLRATLQEYH